MPGPARTRCAGLLATALLVAVICGCGGAAEQDSAAETGGKSGAVGRVSGADPAIFASNVAFTVYPANTVAQKPKSVILVAEDSWQTAIAASVFMAEPMRAPLLISSANGAPEATTSAVNVFQPHGNRLKHLNGATNKGPAFFTTGTVATPSFLSGGRTAKTPETTGAPQARSIEAFRKTLFREATKQAVIAPEDDPAFAMPAAAWAAHSGDPVLYTRKDKLSRATMFALERFRPTAYVLGPPSVISQSVVAEIGKIAKGVTRISGKTPAENAIAFARYSGDEFGWNVNSPGHRFVIARSDRPLEAALASPLSAFEGSGPLLLTESADELPAAVRTYLRDVTPSHVWIVGDDRTISASQQAEIEQLTDASKR